MHEIGSPLADTKLIELAAFSDARGSFSETYNKAAFGALGITCEFVQDNEAMSARTGTMRGLHFQLAPHAQGKLVRVLQGSVFDVVVDIRPTSPTFREHATVTLKGLDRIAFWIPPGFAHGYCTLEPETVIAYKTTAHYVPQVERSMRYDDPDLGIRWPIDPDEIVISERDAAAPLLREIEHEL